MKMVVNSVLYDTSEAELCGTYTPHKANLYRRTDDGTFFLVKVSHQSYRSPAEFCTAVRVWETIETIVKPMSDADAQMWAEHNLDPDTVNALFGD